MRNAAALVPSGDALPSCGTATWARAVGLGVALCAWTGSGLAAEASIKIAVFLFELEDFSEVVAKFTSELRMGADYSWSRGVCSVLQNQMLSVQAPAP